jgi:hypothetical protein
MATKPERTAENLNGSRDKLVEVYRLWFPKNTPEEQAAKVNAVMQTLVVYGYGALPSDPVQAKAKINMFCRVVEEVPAWAVEAAGVWWVKTVEDNPPAPAQLLSRARLEMGWYDKIELGDSCDMELGRVYDKVKGWIKDEPR